jgi:hypothetical protein
VGHRKTCPLVMIEWEDSSQPLSSWQYLADFGEPRAIICRSVGWLLVSNRRTTVVVPNMGGLDSPDAMQASGTIVIPTRAVRKVFRLREPNYRFLDRR